MNNYKLIPARWFTRGRIKPVQLLVIHSAETPEMDNTAENVARYFATTETKASAHFTVDRNSVVQSVQLSDTAWHCKNANANGIGIEHAGRAKQTEAEWLDSYGIAMLDLSAKLCAELCDEYDIPPTLAEFAGPNDPRVVKAGFTGHRDVPNHGSHWDPGPGFPMAYYLGRVTAFLQVIRAEG